MEKIFEIASSIATPLELSGLFAAIVFFTFRQILQRDKRSPEALRIVDRLFVLSLVAMVLGFAWSVVPNAPPRQHELRPEPPYAQVAPKPVIYKTCRHPDFGQVGWARSEIVDQSSGRRGGGSSPQNWCNELANSFIQARSIGPQHAVEVLETHESNDKDFFGHVTYNYSCKLRVSWEPIYAERQDPRCGVVEGAN